MRFAVLFRILPDASGTVILAHHSQPTDRLHPRGRRAMSAPGDPMTAASPPVAPAAAAAAANAMAPPPPAIDLTAASDSSDQSAAVSLLPRLRKKGYRFSCTCASLCLPRSARSCEPVLTAWCPCEQPTRARTTPAPSTASPSATCCPSTSVCSRPSAGTECVYCPACVHVRSSSTLATDTGARRGRSQCTSASRTEVWT